MIERFLETLNIPESCILGKPIFKKLFLENGQLDITDKKALKDDVDKIRWLYTLKPSTINIAAYQDKEREFLEVAVLQVDLSSTTRTKRIAAFIHKTIPYPLLIIFTQGEQMALSVAEKRINQADKSKWVVKHNWITEWIDLKAAKPFQKEFMDDCAISGMSFTDFKAFYQDLINRVITLCCGEKTGAYNRRSLADSEKQIEMLMELEKLDLKKAELRNRLRKEKQMGKQVEINGKIKSMTDLAENILAKLKHGEEA